VSRVAGLNQTLSGVAGTFVPPLGALAVTSEKRSKAMNRRRLHQQMVCLGLVALLLIGCSGAQATRPDSKRALFVVYERFEESEYGIPRAILEDRQVVVTVASVRSGAVTGHKGTEVQPDVLLDAVRGGTYDAIVFVGGYEYERDDPEAQRIVQEALAEGKVVAAICVAPITLARAGVVEGKRVTASTGAGELKQAGAIFTGASVERDGLIITANGPAAARQFGEAIAAALGE